MANISNLLNDAGNAYDSRLKETRGLVSKWEKTGLLEGIGAEYDKSGMAVLLENQARQLIDEASNTSSGTASKEQWSGVALPLVRRVFGEIAAKDFVSVEYFMLLPAPPLLVPLPSVINVVSCQLFNCTDWPKEPPKNPSPEPDRLFIAVLPAKKLMDAILKSP